MRTLLRHFTDDLSGVYGIGESRAISLMLMSHLWPDKDGAQLFLIEDDKDDYERAYPFLRRLAAGEPVQYVIGYTVFCGLRIGVGPGVLIPRPETEMLVGIMAKRLKNNRSPRLLDICTGSGCIALALKSLVPECSVDAWDISPDALSYAIGNAHSLGLEVEFSQVDVLAQGLADRLDGRYDLIVSNPPYVTEGERADMDGNVLNYEPPLSLFVPDSDPLLFYRKIAGDSIRLLKDGGVLGFEINPRFAYEMHGLLEDIGYDNVVLAKDQFDRYRFVIAERR